MSNIPIFHSFILALITIISAQEISINPLLIWSPQIEQDYSIVKKELYPSSFSTFKEIYPEDYFVVKLTQQNLSKKTQIVSKAKQVEVPLFVLFDNEERKQIQIINKNQNVPVIQDYHAFNIIYPFAQIIQPDLLTNIQAMQASSQNGQQNSQNEEDHTRTQISNKGKVIEWKINEIAPLNQFVIDKDEEIPLSKSEIFYELGSAQIGIEGVLPNDTKKQPQIKQPSLTTNPQPRLSVLPPPPPGKTLGESQEQDKQIKHGVPIVSNNKEQIEQYERVRYKNHRWTLIIIVLILIIVLLFFIILQCMGNRNAQFWSDLNKKLENYRNSTQLSSADEEEQIISNKNNDFIENEEH